jgi:tetratricopeptide (TPR) repeat protein
MKYPRVQELKRFHEELWAKVAGSEINSLEKAKHSRARVEDLARLIELYRSVKNFDRCLAISREANRKFPNSWLLKLAAGKALYHRYLHRRSRGDGERAVEFLQQARSLNPKCERALLYLAALLFEFGQRAEAAAVAEELVQIAPQNERAKRLRARITDLDREVKTAAPARRPTVQLTPDAEILDSLLEKLKGEEAIYGAMIYDSRGHVSHKHMVSNEHFQMEGHEESLIKLAKAFDTASERMGIGHLQSSSIEGDPWRIYFADLSGCTLAVLANRSFGASSFESIASRFSIDVVNNR